MIEIVAVLVGPFASILVQDFRESVKEYGVVGADGVVGDCEFECHRDERERNDDRSAQIAFGVHPYNPSSFSALVFAGHREFSSICLFSSLNSGWSGLSSIAVSISTWAAERSFFSSNVFARRKCVLALRGSTSSARRNQFSASASWLASRAMTPRLLNAALCFGSRFKTAR